MAEKHLSRHDRKLVQQRAQGCCEYCLSQSLFSPDPFSVEHILPRAAGGTSDPENLALSCQGCNNRKYTSTTGIDPESGRVVELFHPRKHHWHEHFRWGEDYSRLVGLTPTGRATIEKLALNREPLVKLREILSKSGDHPPARFRVI